MDYFSFGVCFRLTLSRNVLKLDSVRVVDRADQVHHLSNLTCDLISYWAHLDQGFWSASDCSI